MIYIVIIISVISGMILGAYLTQLFAWNWLKRMFASHGLDIKKLVSGDDDPYIRREDGT